MCEEQTWVLLQTIAKHQIGVNDAKCTNIV